MAAPSSVCYVSALQVCSSVSDVCGRVNIVAKSLLGRAFAHSLPSLCPESNFGYLARIFRIYMKDFELI